MTDVGVVVGQLLRLLGDRLGDLFAAVADVHAVEAGEGVEQAGAVAVADVDTLAAGNDARTPLAARKLREVGRGMEEAVPVPGFPLDRKSGVSGKSVSVRVDLGGRRILKKKKNSDNKQQT